ncbi:MAG TPA: hypothetical protein VF666_03395 [Pyrinomonadaceae bacterium]|jgi:hypothetical protein
MVFLLAAALLLSAWRFTLVARRQGVVFALKSLSAAAILGLLAGVFIGVGARTGMSAITVANGDAPSFTLSGSFSVVATFASFGILLGVVYEALFRQLLRRSGLAYGLLLTLCTWYPLAHAATQQLTGHLTFFSLLVVTGLSVALMWLPYAVALEALLKRWHAARTPQRQSA